MKKVYLAGPISGLTYNKSDEWRIQFRDSLPRDIHCIFPMYAEEHLKDQGVLGDHVDCGLMSSAKAILLKDEYYVREADVVVANFLPSVKPSYGSVMECAWAYLLRKPLVVVMAEGNTHWHAMLREAAGWAVPTLGEARTVVFGLLGAVQ